MTIEISENEMTEIDEMINNNFGDMINCINDIDMCLNELNIDDSEIYFD